MRRRAERASRAGTVISWARIVPVMARAWNAKAKAKASAARVRLGAIAGEVERDRGEHQPRCVCGEHPGRQVRQRPVLQSAMTLLSRTES